ncbi:hypothetical protein VD0004_g7207 [Verticillium dahliae]|nr:hypothetical protein VD0004_g7207 [Verticillium dahliae]
MPTTAEPSKQAPMQAVVDLASQKTLDSGPVVTRQPTLEPRPEAEPVLGLRGGGLSCGFDCCLGSCRFHKACC